MHGAETQTVLRAHPDPDGFLDGQVLRDPTDAIHHRHYFVVNWKLFVGIADRGEQRNGLTWRGEG